MAHRAGRNPSFLGVRRCDLRMRFLHGAQSRGFYARYRPSLRLWECQLSGYGMRPRRWFSPTQTLALAEIRLIPSLFSWRPVVVDESIAWDGIRDTGFVVNGRGQLELFRDAA